jgi:hypothetical protein
MRAMASPIHLRSETRTPAKREFRPGKNYAVGEELPDLVARNGDRIGSTAKLRLRQPAAAVANLLQVNCLAQSPRGSLVWHDTCEISVTS